MPELILKLGDNVIQRYFFVKETMRIGRTPENEVVIDNLAVSRTHATIQFEDEHYVLNDMGSSNGTHVNGVRVKKTELMDRDIITVGKHKLYFYDHQAAEVQRRPTLAEGERTMLVQEAQRGVVEVIKGRQKGQRFDLNAVETSMGRGGESDIRLSDWFVSKNHAMIERRGANYMIRDMGSWRHTMVNGTVVDQRRLEDGDVIQLGPTVQLRFFMESALEELPAQARVPMELGEPIAAPPDDARPLTGPVEAQIDSGAPEEEACEPGEPAEEAPEAEPAQAPQEIEEEETLEKVVIASPEVEAEAEVEPAPPAPEAGPEGSQQGPEDEVLIWERALKNKSEIIRRQAARRLKQLTGRDYDY